LFGIVNEEEKRVDYAVEIPKLSSLILKHDLNAPMDGLDTIPDELEPPITIVFWSFRVMVGLGFAMLGLGLWSLWARYRRTFYESIWLHRAAFVMGPTGFVAVLAGWVTTEVGRQPFTVYGLLRTSDSLAPIAAPAVAASLIAFIVVYFFIFGAGTFYLLRMMGVPPKDADKIKLREGPLRSTGIHPAPPPRTTPAE
ncbi:MAG: cytochrome ubiquinol oxidase subunit I, partial [Litoreibacter sp.]|nr:cytochrome ubiquinol oxidase subunit I [Litoreibacter sp.]